MNSGIEERRTGKQPKSIKAGFRTIGTISVIAEKKNAQQSLQS